MVRRGCGVRVCVKCMVRLSLWICRHAQRSAPEQQAIVRPLSAKSHVSIPTRIVSQCLLTSNPASNGSTIGTAGANPFSVWRTNDVEGSIVILRAGKSIRPFDAVGKRININRRSQATFGKASGFDFLVGIFIEIGTSKIGLGLQCQVSRRTSDVEPIGVVSSITAHSQYYVKQIGHRCL